MPKVSGTNEMEFLNQEAYGSLKKMTDLLRLKTFSYELVLFSHIQPKWPQAKFFNVTQNGSGNIGYF